MVGKINTFLHIKKAHCSVLITYIWFSKTLHERLAPPCRYCFTRCLPGHQVFLPSILDTNPSAMLRSWQQNSMHLGTWEYSTWFACLTHSNKKDTNSYLPPARSSPLWGGVVLLGDKGGSRGSWRFCGFFPFAQYWASHASDVHWPYGCRTRKETTWNQPSNDQVGECLD